MRTIRGAVAACLAALLSAAAPPGSAGEVREVHISAYRFEPASLTVRRGTRVRWVNEDDDAHTVTSDRDAFSSRGLDRHEDFTFTFEAAGTYPYHCALHPMMTGTVVVN